GARPWTVEAIRAAWRLNSRTRLPHDMDTPIPDRPGNGILGHESRGGYSSSSAELARSISHFRWRVVTNCETNASPDDGRATPRHSAPLVSGSSQERPDSLGPPLLPSRSPDGRSGTAPLS